MTRPKSKEAKQQYTVMLKPSIVEEIDRIAERIGLTRSQLLGNMLEIGLEEARAMEKLGILNTVVIMRKIKEAVFGGKVSIDEKGELEIKK